MSLNNSITVKQYQADTPFLALTLSLMWFMYIKVCLLSIITDETQGVCEGWWQCATCLKPRSFWTKISHVIHWVATVAETFCFSSPGSLNLQPPPTWLHLIHRFHSLKLAALLLSDRTVFGHMSEVVPGSDGINFWKADQLHGWTEAGPLQTPQLIMMVGMESGQTVP